jgi:hypothetical protein
LRLRPGACKVMRSGVENRFTREWAAGIGQYFAM